MKAKLLSTIRTPGRKKRPRWTPLELQKLDPGAEEVSRFLATTGDTQLEHAKAATWRMLFSAAAFPPSILFRLLIDLQTKEKALDDGKRHRPRDHFRHALYVHALGVTIYEENMSIRRRIDEQLSFLKRKHGLTKVSNCEVFAELWKCFVLFHDIAYPIERLHCDKEDVRALIETDLLLRYSDLQNTYCDEYVLRIVANLSALISQTDLEEIDFQHLVHDHLPENKKEELSQQISGSEAELQELLSSRPFSAIGPQSVSLLGTICGHGRVFFTIELSSTGELLWVSDLSGKVCVKVRESKKFTDSDPRRIVFRPAPPILDELNVEYYLLPGADLSHKLADIFGSESLYEDLATLSAEMREQEGFLCAVARADRADANLGALAYSLLCSSDFVDYNDERRFEEQPLPDVIRSTMEKFQKEIPGLFCGSFGAILQNRLEEGTFQPAEVISTNEINAGHQKMVSSAFGLDEFLKLLKRKLRAEFRGGKVTERDALRTLDEGLQEFVAIDSNTIGQLIVSLKSEIKPRIMRNVKRATAIGRCFSIIKPTVEEVVSKAASAEGGVFRELFHAQLTEPSFLRELYAKLDQYKVMDKVSRKERQALREIGSKYEPKWAVDHGLFSGILFLGHLEFTNTLLSQIKDRSSSSIVERLMLDNGFDFDPSLKIKLNNVVSEVGFRAIALHNFYPSECAEFATYKHNVNDFPFTFFAIITDALQNWDRDVQYNPGRSDLRTLKPENFYDITILDDRIILHVNGRYTDLKRVDELKREFSSYLRDIDSFLEVQVFY